ncbi:expressed unknown protein [Seminavis robusta]|uniref:Uncharacterized protein n=1 Tax=Seminavis robusta TaxID=568900 RepID=A0A9N8DQE9_9STRA|nr:expressed unknown protein [Seminavis robusta]|eukprot:Sro280_g107110.1 n/a (148) ;mRNA; f:64734-65258
MSSRMEKAANNETEEHSSLSSGVYVSDANPTPPRHQNLLAAHDEASTDNVQRIAAHADHRTNSSSSDADAAFDSELTKEAATCTTDAGSGPRKCTPVTNVSSIEEDVKSAEHDSYSQESPHIPCTKMGAKVHTVVACGAGTSQDPFQ